MEFSLLTQFLPLKSLLHQFRFMSSSRCSQFAIYNFRFFIIFNNKTNNIRALIHVIFHLSVTCFVQYASNISLPAEYSANLSLVRLSHRSILVTYNTTFTYYIINISPTIRKYLASYKMYFLFYITL